MNKSVGETQAARAKPVEKNQTYRQRSTESPTPVTRLDEAIVKQTLEQNEHRELDVAFDTKQRILWYAMNPIERPSATVGLMQDIRKLQDCVRSIFERSPDPLGPPIRYMVLGSAMPRIFNLGGDLGLFSQLIRQRNRQALTSYARLSIGVIHANAVNLNLPLITISLVQGDALGGGFEAALSSNLMVAERGTKFGLPEILFNLFPGMGAYSFLARKIEPAQAEKMIFSGKIYTADELYEMGIIDILAEPGEGRAAIYDYVDKHSYLHSSHRSIYKVRHRINPVDYEEMADISDIWVEAALSLSDQDLHRMDRLATAQSRRWEKAKRTMAATADRASLNLVSGEN
ncbi:MAG: crotonase/enoyl-CoA hydratase family protein [Alphaproteobacteria bacterium]|nr:crotonase/enoyl-CoA hydratase family protein [Alphaproteobacteria bacterium]